MTSLAYAGWTPESSDREKVAGRIKTHEGREFRWWVQDDMVHVGLPWWEYERAALLELDLPSKQPTYSSGLIPYTKIPFGVRVKLNRVRIALLRAKARDRGFPADPVETGLDGFRREVWREACRLAGVAMVDDMSKTLVLTHDLDEDYGWPGVASLRGVERQLGVRSAFGVLSKRYTLPEADLQRLLDEGCEVYSHGYLHDGTLAFLPQAELHRRLTHFFQVYPSLRGHVRGFRSGQLVRSAAMFEVVADVFEYDMTPPTVELGGPHGWRTGCATTVPFADEHGLPHLPLTLPQDYFMAFIDRMTSSEMADLWMRAAHEVWAVGGVVVNLVHPDNVRRRPQLVDAYREFLERALDAGAEVRLPGEVMTSLGVRR